MESSLRGLQKNRGRNGCYRNPAANDEREAENRNFETHKTEKLYNRPGLCYACRTAQLVFQIRAAPPEAIFYILRPCRFFSRTCSFGQFR
jgi:hypothetical protein